jgi:hypothetical protein
MFVACMLNVNFHAAMTLQQVNVYCMLQSDYVMISYYVTTVISSTLKNRLYTGRKNKMKIRPSIGSHTIFKYDFRERASEKDSKRERERASGPFLITYSDILIIVTPTSCFSLPVFLGYS